jgi:HK97 family phage prohead protease
MKETRFFNPEFRAFSDDGQKCIAGYAAVFDMWSDDLGWFREKIQRGAFSEAIGKSDTVALFNHDSNLVLGRVSNGTLRLKEDERGLYMEVDLPDTQAASDLYKLIERGDIKQQSFGFIVDGNEWNKAKDERTITKVRELIDVSPVTFPAYPDTTVAKRSRDEVSPGNGASEAEGAILKENEDIEIDLLLTRHTRGMK